MFSLTSHHHTLWPLPPFPFSPLFRRTRRLLFHSPFSYIKWSSSPHPEHIPLWSSHSPPLKHKNASFCFCFITSQTCVPFVFVSLTNNHREKKISYQYHLQYILWFSANYSFNISTRDQQLKPQCIQKKKMLQYTNPLHFHWALVSTPACCDAICTF